MLEVLEILCLICFIVASLSCIIVATVVFINFIKSLFKKREEPRNPTPREKLEMENGEFDYGHNVKNYTEDCL